MNYLEGQIILKQALITEWNAIIVSGYYKHRKVYKTIRDVERPLTEEELLKDAVDILKRHTVQLMHLTEELPHGTN